MDFAISLTKGEPEKYQGEPRGVDLKRVDPHRAALEPRRGGFRCAPVVGGEAMILLRQKSGATRPTPIVIGHVEGSLRIVQLRQPHVTSRTGSTRANKPG